MPVQRDVPGRLWLGLDSFAIAGNSSKKSFSTSVLHTCHTKNRSKTELSPAKKFMKFGLLLGVEAVGDCSSLMKVCAV